MSTDLGTFIPISTYNDLVPADEFHDFLEENERLQAAVIKAACRQMCEDPRIKRLTAKRRR
ncbi:hypothetical protein ACVW1A_005971 [Bradyrhizobium sp. LB1.3]